jgi:hypothetical protein
VSIVVGVVKKNFLTGLILSFNMVGPVVKERVNAGDVCMGIFLQPKEAGSPLKGPNLKDPMDFLLAGELPGKLSEGRPVHLEPIVREIMDPRVQHTWERSII